MYVCEIMTVQKEMVKGFNLRIPVPPPAHLNYLPWKGRGNLEN